MMNKIVDAARRRAYHFLGQIQCSNWISKNLPLELEEFGPPLNRLLKNLVFELRCRHRNQLVETGRFSTRWSPSFDRVCKDCHGFVGEISSPSLETGFRSALGCNGKHEEVLHPNGPSVHSPFTKTVYSLFTKTCARCGLHLGFVANPKAPLMVTENL